MNNKNDYIRILKKIYKNNRKIILIVLALIILTIFGIFISKKFTSTPNNKKRETYSHNGKGIVEDTEYKGIKFTNVSMVTEKGYTTFTATVTNESEEDIVTERVHINLLDKNGNSVIKLLGFIPGGLKKGESKQLTSSVQGKFDNVYSKEIVDYSLQTEEGK